MKAAFPLARARTILLLLTLLFAVGCRGSYVVTGDPQTLGDVAVGASVAAEVVITATSPNTIVGGFGVESEQNCVVTATTPPEFQPGGPGDLRLANGEAERIPVTLTPLAPGPFCGTFFAPEDSREAGQTSDIADPEHSTTICGNAVGGGDLELSVQDLDVVVPGDDGTFILVAENVGTNGALTITDAQSDGTLNIVDSTIDLTGGDTTIPEGGQSLFPATFVPDLAGDYQIQLRVSWQAGDGGTIDSSLVVEGETGETTSRFTSGEVSALGTDGRMELSYDCLPVDTTTQRTITLSNEGDALLRVASATVETATLQDLELAVTASPPQGLDTGESADIGIAFKALDPGGSFSGTVNVTTNEGLTFAIDIVGTASQDGAILAGPDPADIGDWLHLVPGTAPVTLTNPGNEAVTLSEVVVDPNDTLRAVDLSVVDFTAPATIEACGSLDVSVGFRPECVDDSSCQPQPGTFLYDFVLGLDVTHDGDNSVTAIPVLGHVTGAGTATYTVVDASQGVINDQDAIQLGSVNDLATSSRALSVVLGGGSVAPVQLDAITLKKLLAAGSDDTVISRSYSGKTLRMIRTAWSEEWERPEAPVLVRGKVVVVPKGAVLGCHHQGL